MAIEGSASRESFVVEVDLHCDETLKFDDEPSSCDVRSSRIESVAIEAFKNMFGNDFNGLESRSINSNKDLRDSLENPKIDELTENCRAFRQTHESIPEWKRHLIKLGNDIFSKNE